MAPPAIATPSLLVDPGWLFWAPLASTMPSNTVVGSVFTDAWPAAWLPLGATAEGSTLSYEINVEAMSVAELFDPVKYATTGRTGSIAFALANWSMTNLKRALNGGTITATGATTTTMSSYAFPTPGQEVRAMIGWESSDSTVRVVVLQALSSGTIEMAFQKAPDFSQIPVTFNMELPAGGSQPFNVYTAGVVRG
jgi:hypothetical protein